MDNLAPQAARAAAVAHRVAFVAADTAEARDASARLTARYGEVPPSEASLIVALGGDGLMLETLHRYMDRGLPIFGMNCGSVGFRLNDYREDGLVGRRVRAQAVALHPLRMVARTVGGETIEALAINEISLLRETRQAAKLRISIDGVQRLDELVCDGCLVATTAGSTA